jgi:hypothetical protein
MPVEDILSDGPAMTASVVGVLILEDVSGGVLVRLLVALPWFSGMKVSRHA